MLVKRLKSTCQFLNKAFCPPWLASWDEEQGADASSVPVGPSLQGHLCHQHKVWAAAKDPAGHRGGGWAAFVPLLALWMWEQAGGCWQKRAVDVALHLCHTLLEFLLSFPVSQGAALPCLLFLPTIVCSCTLKTLPERDVAAGILCQREIPLEMTLMQSKWLNSPVPSRGKAEEVPGSTAGKRV